MLHCQALSVARPGAGIAARPLRSAVARPQRCLVVAAAPPDGGSGQPPSSRRPASRLEPLPATEQLGSSPRLGAAAPHSSGHHGAHGAGAAAAPAHPKDSQAPVEPGSWEDWQRYFYEMDDVVNELESLYSEQEEAVAREDYRAAAALKAQREALEAADTVGEAMGRLSAAIAEERFEDAARLRDQAAVSAVGWWVGRGSGDPCGHLLRVTSDFSRYVGQVYTPRDLTELLPNKVPSESEDSRTRMLAALQQKQRELAGGAFNNPEEEQQQEEEELTPDELGLPVLELFIRRTEDGGYEQQAVALFAPDQPSDDDEQPEGLAAEEVAKGIAEMIVTDTGDGSVVSVERGQKEDGSSFVTIEISSLADSGLTREEAELQARLSGDLDSDDENAEDADDDDDEDIRTIDDLAASVGVQPDDDASSSSSAGAAASAGAAEVSEEEAEKLARWQDMAAKLGSMDQQINETVEAIEQALMQGSGGDGGSADGGPRPWQLDASGNFSETIDEALSQVQSPSDMGTFLQRAPAKISWHGRDCFTVSVSEPPVLRETRKQQAAAEAAAAAVEEPPKLQRPPVRIIYDGKEQQRGQQPQAGPDGSSSSSSSRRSADGSLDVEVTAEESDSEEVSVLLSPSAAQQQAQQAQQQQQDVAQPPASPEQRLQSEQEAIAADSAALAEQIESLQGDMLAGRKPSQEKINEIARRAMGLALAQGMNSAAQGDATAERWGLEGQTTYQRVQLNSFVKTDPFNGLYLGTFGPHGPELLQVSRQMEGGQEYVVATKLTGDPNVPAGAVSWKAVIGRNSRLPVEMYPPEMGVMGRYRGQGQVAQTGYSNARWVDGELLVFADGSPFVQGAQLGFTYDVGTHQRYLIVLHRLDLDEIFPGDA